MSEYASEHSTPNGHSVDCFCDLCDNDGLIGFYSCTCYMCDPLCNSGSCNNHDDRHSIVCECGGDVYDCTRYPHTYWTAGDDHELRCDCHICAYDPMHKCDGCPVCLRELYIAHAQNRYNSDHLDEQPEILETQETPMFKYEIQQWISPAGIWVAAIPKIATYSPMVETCAFDISDARNAIREMIVMEFSHNIVVPRKWSDIPKICASARTLASQETIAISNASS